MVKRKNTEKWITVAIIGLFLLVRAVFILLMLPGSKQFDFVGYYSASRLVLTGQWAHFYDPAVQFATERSVAPTTTQLIPFVRPPFYALFLAPLALLPFDDAFRLWAALQAAAWLVIIALAFRFFGADAAMLTVMFAYLPIAIGASQDTCLVSLTMTIGWLLLRADKGMAAGLVMSFALEKYNLIFLLPLGLLWLSLKEFRYRSLLVGFASGGAVWALLSVALVGPKGILDYVQLLRNPNVPNMGRGDPFLVTAGALLANFGLESIVLQGLLSGLALVLMALALRRPWPAWRPMTALVACSLFVVPHAYNYDLSILLPFLLASYQSSRWFWTRAWLAWLLCPLPPLVASRVPWAAIQPASLLVLLLLLAIDAARDPGIGDVSHPSPEVVYNKVSEPTVGA